MSEYSWTQPCCEACWIKDESKLDETGQYIVEIRRPIMLNTFTLEQCAWCGNPTIIGIYKREDPTKVLYPRLKETDV